MIDGERDGYNGTKQIEKIFNGRIYLVGIYVDCTIF